MEIKTMGKASIIILSAAFISIIILHFQPGRVINAGGCGPRALYSVACQLKVSCSEAQILGLFSDDGFEVSLDDMQSALPKLGLTGNIRDFKISDLLREKPVGILHIDDVHFVL